VGRLFFADRPIVRAWFAIAMAFAVPGALACSRESVPAPDAFPAFPFDLPRILNSGGPTLTQPSLVVVLDPRDSQASALVPLLDGLGASDYWRTVASEYGAGPLGPVSFVHRTDFPATVTGKAMHAWIAQAMVDIGSTRGTDAKALPLPEGDGGASLPTGTLYLFVAPPSTTLSDVSCDVFGGYHAAAPLVPTTVYVPYGLVRGDCPVPGVPPVDVSSTIATHEIVEAVTDPFVDIRPSWLGVDYGHPGYFLRYPGGPELADICETEQGRAMVNGLDWAVAKVWSNAAAQRGASPCVPGNALDSFYAMPVLVDTVLLSPGVSGTGVAIDVGQTVTVDVRVTSTGPFPLQLAVYDVATFGSAKQVPSANGPELVLVLDRALAYDGDVVHLSITRRAAPPADALSSGSAFTVVATDPAKSEFRESVGFVGSRP
jgi:hypothetical protein